MAQSTSCFTSWTDRLGRMFSSHGHQLEGVLTIRNLTSQQLSISEARSIYAAGVAQRSQEQAETLDVPRSLAPFSTNSTISQDDKGAASVSRVDLLDAQQNKTATLYDGPVKAKDDTREEITTIFDPINRFLTLFETPDLSCWMKDFRDDTSIAALSIPGTHNSPTCHWALPSVRCQAVSPEQQLLNGVRFFDIRVQPVHPEDPTNDTLYLVHGAFPTSLVGYKKFRDLITTIEAFLQSHPSETLIMSVKREGISKASDQQISEILATHYAQNWYTDPSIPTLGQARGKIVLMRRFGLSDRLQGEHEGRGWGLDAQSWEDNTASCIHGQVCVQDFYEVLSTKQIPTKIEVSCAQFERAGAVICPAPGTETQSPQYIYLNFLTASNFFNPRCWPENIAKKLNPEITAFLCQKHDYGDTGTDDRPSNHGDGGLGIVVCDWVGKHGNWDLVNCIIGMNSRRLVRERGHGWT